MNKATIIKHLCNVTKDKNSLWVKRISTIKLKVRSIWVVNEELTDSWGWKNLLRLRKEVKDLE